MTSAYVAMPEIVVVVLASRGVNLLVTVAVAVAVVAGLRALA